MSSIAVLTPSCRRGFPVLGEDPPGAAVLRVSAPWMKYPSSLFHCQKRLLPWSSQQEEAHPPAPSLSTKVYVMVETNPLSFNNDQSTHQNNEALLKRSFDSLIFLVKTHGEECVCE